MAELPIDIWVDIFTISECMLSVDAMILDIERSRVRQLCNAVNDSSRCHDEVLGCLRDVCKSRMLTLEIVRKVRQWRIAEEIFNEYDGGPHVIHRQRMRDEIDARLFGPVV